MAESILEQHVNNCLDRAQMGDDSSAAPQPRVVSEESSFLYLGGFLNGAVRRTVLTFPRSAPSKSSNGTCSWYY